MFSEMRRKDRQLDHDEIIKILGNEKYGVLSFSAEKGYPYGVPMHYVMIDQAIYFHCSRQIGHKLRAIQENSNVCFTIVESENGIQCKSVIIFGKVEIVEDKRFLVLEKLVEKFVEKKEWDRAKASILKAEKKIIALQLTSHHMSGKWVDKV